MIILIKNKHTLVLDEFIFQCCIGKKGLTALKVEGDLKTPKGVFGIEHLYFRQDKINKPKTKLKCIKINKKMGLPSTNPNKMATFSSQLSQMHSLSTTTSRPRSRGTTLCSYF